MRGCKLQGLGLAVAATFLVTSSVNATITDYELLKLADYTQTSDAQPTTLTEYSAVEQVVSSAGDFTSASFSGGGSSLTLPGSNGTFIAGQIFSTKGALDAAVPNGTTFTFALTGGTYGGQTATVTSFATDQYPPSVPYLTGTTFDSLQNVNAAHPINLTFNSQPNGSSVIISTSSGAVYSNFTLPASATSLLLPANTLQPGQTYQMDLLSGAIAATSGFTPPALGLMFQGDTTIVDFTTSRIAAPEFDPSSLAAGLTLLLGALAVLRGRWQRIDRAA